MMLHDVPGTIGGSYSLEPFRVVAALRAALVQPTLLRQQGGVARSNHAAADGLLQRSGDKILGAVKGYIIYIIMFQKVYVCAYIYIYTGQINNQKLLLTTICFAA